MMLSDNDVLRFRAAIRQRLGLSFDESKLSQLEEVLERRLDAGGGLSAQYLRRLESDERLPEEIRSLTAELTVSETYFFRNNEQFHALQEVALPRLLAARALTRKLSLLSVGCASGEEPYSLAIATRETVTEPQWSVSIRALDVNPKSLARAHQGRYTAWSLRETPEAVQRRWFHQEGTQFQLDPAIRALVQFEEHNLAEESMELWQPATYDVVFFRNVLMYLAPECAQAVIRHITTSLVPGGYLFLGHAETLRGLSQDYHLCHTHGTFYYQRKNELGSAQAQPAEPTRREQRSNGSDLGWAATWLETVQRTTSRIEALTVTQMPTGPANDQVRPLQRGFQPHLGLSLQLLKEERFAEALELLGSLPAESVQDPEVLLLRAVLLTHGGQLTASEEVCRQLLALDECNAGAHYLLALCREAVNDCQGATNHDQVAAYLDPSFAMPRLHLGLMARRASDAPAACRELEQALSLLHREDVARILLFGGGFSRETLISLCRAEWLAAGGTP